MSRPAQTGGGSRSPASDEPLLRFRVDLQADRYDSDSHRFYVEVWAADPEAARVEVTRLHPHAGIRRVEVVA